MGAVGELPRRPGEDQDHQKAGQEQQQHVGRERPEETEVEELVGDVGFGEDHACPGALKRSTMSDLEGEVDEEEGHERQAERSRTHGRGVLEDQEQGDQHHEPDEEASGEGGHGRVMPPLCIECRVTSRPTTRFTIPSVTPIATPRGRRRCRT